jgi:hypothetical protein
VDSVETSAGGRAVRKLASNPSTPGNTVMLSIDIRLQKLVEDMYGERRGALVALDPRNGEVLAFVSKPTFDPNLFVDGIDAENWQMLNESIDKPLLNRALRGTYPPGSTYKPFMALAALQTGKRSASTGDPGRRLLDLRRPPVPQPRRHGLGPVDMHAAIAKSSNVYFYSLANEMGVDAIHDFMKPLGFGQITGIDIQGESRGMLPSQELEAQLLQEAEAAEVVCRRDHLAGHRPGLQHLHDAAAGPGDCHAGEQRRQAQAAAGDRHPGHADAAGHAAATGRPGGSGLQAGERDRRTQRDGQRDAGGHVDPRVCRRAVSVGWQDRDRAGGGHRRQGALQRVKLEEHQRDHALYVAYAPADNPRIVVAAIVENAGFWCRQRGTDHAARVRLLADRRPARPAAAAGRLAAGEARPLRPRGDPERRMHAKGSGAYGTFTVTHDITKYTRAKIFSKVGKKTEMFARFTTVAGERGAADAERDIRGFALKFYTEEGNWDMVGNNTPVFFLRDPLKFPDLNHAVKRDPRTNMRSATNNWDFWTLAARGPAPGHHRHERPRHPGQLPPHARLRLAHLQLHQREERALLGQVPLPHPAGHQEPDRRRGRGDHRQGSREPPARPVREHRARRLPEVDAVKVQVMPEQDAAKVPYNPFDLTKVWPHKPTTR